jgi:predicted lipoprotein with Yx(FWY)xxD motif
MKRSTIAFAVMALTSTFGLAACAPTGVQADYVAAPAAPRSTAGTDLPPEPSAVPELQGGAEETPDAPSTPIPEPTVAKTQKWVKIYSGESNKEITPPKSIRKGSKTVELNSTESDVIGTYVTDGAGRTLYRFDEDSAKPPKATCNGDCAEAWPPLLIKSPGKIFPKGIDPKILGYVERADGTCQVTINGWPVYYFAKDAKPGDILGQGVKGTWFAVSPTGGKTKALPADDAGTGGADAPDNPGY